jgi:RNA polymerase sigma-70 factor (ECF subfamily)
LAEKNLHSFEGLFKSLFKPLCGFAFRYIADRDDARGIVHEAFVSLWEKFDQLPPNSNYRSYLYTTVRNKALNYIRDKKNHVMLENVNERDVAQHENHMETMELEKKISLAMEALPEKCREVFELNRIEGLKYAEIASKMQISIKTVEAQMSKALSVLRDHLAEFLTILFFLLGG